MGNKKILNLCCQMLWGTEFAQLNRSLVFNLYFDRAAAAAKTIENVSERRYLYFDFYREFF